MVFVIFFKYFEIDEISQKNQQLGSQASGRPIKDDTEQT